MSRTLVAVLFSLSVTCAFAQRESPCWKTATSDSDMNRCAASDASEAEAEMNHVYQDLLLKLKRDGKATKKLRAAQDAWIAFRKAQMEVLFPTDEYRICYVLTATAVTEARTAELRRMLKDEDCCCPGIPGPGHPFEG